MVNQLSIPLLNRIPFKRAQRWLLRKILIRSSGSGFPSGHFYSPLIDVDEFSKGVDAYTHKARSHWERAGLDLQAHLLLHEEFMESATRFPALAHPRYSNQNVYFYHADAFTAAGILRKFQPKRVVEIGSGFSSA